MFSFFRKKSEPAPAPAADEGTGSSAPVSYSEPAPAPGGSAPLEFLKRVFTGAPAPVAPPAPAASPASIVTPEPPRPAAAPATPPIPAPPAPTPAPVASPAPAALSSPPPAAFAPPPSPLAPPPSIFAPAPPAPASVPVPPAAAPVAAPEPPREAWFQRLRKGLARTGNGIAQVFTGTRIDEELYEELESALLMADAGVRATEHLLKDLRERVKDQKATDPARVKALLADAIVALLEPLEASLMVGEHTPTVIMVAGVNGAGKTTSIGKLTRHLAEARCKVLLAAADTFRAAAREQLAVWADRNQVEIVSQEGGDPASVTFDAVTAGRARGCDVVIADTAGRLPTQLHLMEELRKIKRVITKAESSAPHEVLLVVDGNTGQNALEQVKAFDGALGLTGLVVTKLDGTAKGGVLAAIALWSRERAAGQIPVYFIGVGEKLEDLQTFNAREFAQALLG
jgi:fused signal recognition particle receptor